LAYGEDLRECFVNGDEVFPRLHIRIEGDHVSEVTRLSFPNCRSTYVPVPWEHVRGRIVLRPS
jgi:hypothetical protein